MTCPMCYSQKIRWIVVSGKEKIYSFVVCHVAYHPGLENDVPYVVADMELEEGLRLLTNILDCRLDEVKWDMPVEVTWKDVTGEFTLPKFKPSPRWKVRSAIRRIKGGCTSLSSAKGSYDQCQVPELFSPDYLYISSMFVR